MQMPRVLVLHLKRFLPNVVKGSYEKRSDRVRVDREVDLGFAWTEGVDEGEQGGSGREEGEGEEGVGEGTGERAKSVEKEKEDVMGDEQMEDVRRDRDSFVRSSPPDRVSKRVSEEIDLTYSDDSDNSSGSSASSTVKKQKNDSVSPSPPPVKRRPRRHPSPAFEIRVTRAMKRKNIYSSSPARAASPAPPLRPARSPPPLLPSLPAGPLYQLSSIVQHRGTVAYAGHYVTDIVRPGPIWSRYDDQFVKEISAEQSLRHAESEGYIFFFVKDGADVAGGR
jgi:Ubiquitin carboxyl-terminal hydrolase